MRRFAVAIVDVAPVVREGLAAILSRSASAEVVGCYASLAEVVASPHFQRLDVVLMAVGMWRELESSNPLSGLAVVGIQSALAEEDALKRFAGVVTLYHSAEDVMRIVEETVQQPQIHNFADHELSERERDVLILVARGYTNKEIASELNISPHTVISHRKNIVHKTGIRSVAGLTVYAVLNKLIDSEQL